MEPNPGDQVAEKPSESAWLGAEPPKRYADITDAIETKQVEILNRDSTCGLPWTLFKREKPSALDSTRENATTGIDWVESDVDEQLMLFVLFRGVVKVHTIHLTSIPPKSSDDDDDNDDDGSDDESPVRPKTIRLYTNHPRGLSFDEADASTPTQTIELRPDDWDTTTGTTRLNLNFVRFQKVSSLVMYVVDGDGLGTKVRLDRVRLFGQSLATKNLPEFLEHGNAATRSRKDDQLAFAAGEKLIVAALPPGNGPMDLDAMTHKMAAEIAWQIGGLLQGDNKMAASDDWLDRDRWHRLSRETRGNGRRQEDDPVCLTVWEQAARARSAQHNDMAQRGIKGFQQPPATEPTTQLDSFANLTAQKHSCEHCHQLAIDQVLQTPGTDLNLSVDLPQWKERAQSCDTYRILLSTIESHILEDSGEVKVFTQPLSLHTDDRPADAHKTDMPRVFVELVPSAKIQADPSIIPVLPDASSEYEFELCRQWIQLCDTSHAHAKAHDSPLPTRIIDVGTLGSDYVRLRITNGNVRGKYIALSHRWHNDTPTTIKENVHDRRSAIKLSSLPQIYQDAILLTRKLHVRFIWIDSLCILQDDRRDWFFEAEKMEQVYASAYCTIAASSASETGDFEQQVDNGELSRRGWILQERALSRRTIHVMGRQTYWECGSAVWSKTDDRGVKSANILASSFFPQTDAEDTSEGLPTAVQEVFAHYSKLSLTVLADKPVAIAGVERRLQTFYGSRSYYGVFEKFFAESLLWWRSGKSWLSPLIDFKAKFREWTVSGYRVPSWSWMAYAGEIGYSGAGANGSTYATDATLICGESEDEVARRDGVAAVSFSGMLFALSAPLFHLPATCAIGEREDLDCEIRDGVDLVGWARYDCDDTRNLDCRHCVSLAEGTSPWPEYAGSSHADAVPSGPFRHALLLKPEGGGAYRRIGVAVIMSGCLSPSGGMARVF
ncbi:hypothetical protein DL767_005378 [Monosporascus sp. MG133]|nr:hypothetical protein DL767_005378 [Monosporascus sp. MG133]